MCGTCQLCLDVCPGEHTGAAETELRLFGRRRTSEERWSGIVAGVHAVRCPDQRVTSRAAAGAAGTAVLLAALRSGLVEAVVVIGRDAERPWVPRAVLTADEETVIHCAQSTYCIAPNLQVLRDESVSRVGVVGLPCEIQAIGKMKNHPARPAAGAKVVFTLEIACSSSSRLSGTEHLLTDLLGLDLARVRDVRYREGDYPGNFVATTDDGRRHTLPFFRIVEELKRHKTHRCLSCPDWWSGLADLSICDGDPNIFATSRDAVESEPWSTVVTRTDVGQRLLDLARRHDLLTVRESSFDPEVNLGLQRKRHRYNRMRNRSRPVPAPPVTGADDFDSLPDDEVIDRLSERMQPARAD
jgi:coenzyme F420 hydrogenase subunit beta